MAASTNKRKVEPVKTDSEEKYPRNKMWRDTNSARKIEEYVKEVDYWRKRLLKEEWLLGFAKNSIEPIVEYWIIYQSWTSFVRTHKLSWNRETIPDLAGIIEEETKNPTGTIPRMMLILNWIVRKIGLFTLWPLGLKLYFTLAHFAILFEKKIQELYFSYPNKHYGCLLFTICMTLFIVRISKMLFIQIWIWNSQER